MEKQSNKCEKCEICDARFYKQSIKKHMEEVHLNPEPSFECEICGKMLKRQDSKFRHMASVHLKELPEVCPYENCKARFGWKNQIKSHVQAYHTAKDERITFTCQTCSKVYLQNQALQQHIKKDHLGTGVKCPIENCGYSANNKNHLRIHMQTHSKEQPFGCLKCDRKFNNKSNLNRHLKTVHDSNLPKFRCLKCSSKFKTAVAVRRHMKTVHDPNSRIFSCPDCSKKFYSRKNLKSHLETHKDLREKMKCEHCPKEFSKYILRLHIQIYHKNSAKLKCTFEGCGKTFAHKMYLNKHTRNQHQERKYKCYFCGVLFADSRCRNDHMLSKHLKERPFSCKFENCRKNFTTLSNLLSHKKLHTDVGIMYPCPTVGCNKSFRRKKGIESHIKFFHEKNSQCSLCQKIHRDSQALENHIRREHTKETPFRCQACDWKGTSKIKLLKHFRVIHRN